MIGSHTTTLALMLAITTLVAVVLGLVAGQYSKKAGLAVVAFIYVMGFLVGRSMGLI